MVTRLNPTVPWPEVGFHAEANNTLYPNSFLRFTEGSNVRRSDVRRLTLIVGKRGLLDIAFEITTVHLCVVGYAEARASARNPDALPLPIYGWDFEALMVQPDPGLGIRGTVRTVNDGSVDNRATCTIWVPAPDAGINLDPYVRPWEPA